MFNKILRVIIAVNDIQEAIKVYTDNFGLQVSRSESRPDLGIKNALLPVGDDIIEFIEPLDPRQGPVKKFLETRGEGLYQLEIEIDSIDSAVKSLTEKGVRLIAANPESRERGDPVWIHPQSAKGVLIQLVQKS